MNAETCPRSSSTGAANSTFTSAFTLLTAAQCLISETWPENAHVQDKECFDFIVCGAGTAGSLVASRLSENKDWNVLLIEAGDDPPEESIIPYLASDTWYSPKCDWGYSCVNDTNIGQGLKEAIYWPRGKMLGGSGSSNLMIYLRGLDYDYEQWYNAGNKEWELDIVKKYFRKAENLQDPKLLAQPKIKNTYGTKGPLHINLFNSTRSNRAVMKKVLSAYDEIGIENVPDINAARLMGSGFFTATVANGQRTSTATAYLNAARNRSNLKVVKNTLVTKLLIDRKSKSIYGVEVDQNGKTVRYFAKLEVVLSAGAINTPKILMLSGIGPKKTLETHKIDTVVDAPGVGQNLQDQTIVPVPIYADEPKTTKPLNRAANIIRYIADRTGSLADLAFSDVTAFYSSRKDAKIPDFQNLMSIFGVNSSESLPLINAYKPSVAEFLKEKMSKKALYLFQMVLLRPCSRGYITLKSSDPKDPPLIHAQYFKNKKDLDNTIVGLKILTNIVNTSYFKSIKGEIARMKYEPCDGFKFNSTEYWKCVAVNFVTTVFHPMGTAKMGNDKDAVVDSRLRVIGVTGLRVVDASVMPTMPSCNTNGPVIMVAERASDLIKEDCNNKEYVSKITTGKSELIENVGKST